MYRVTLYVSHYTIVYTRISCTHVYRVLFGDSCGVQGMSHDLRRDIQGT